MFGPPGHAYVYLVYGMYDCLNVTTEPDGRPAAVLIRAVSPVDGTDLMRDARIAWAGARRRGWDDARIAVEAARLAQVPDVRLASGPGLVGAAFGLDTTWTGIDMTDPASPLRLEPAPAGEPAPSVATSPRIGVGYAGPPWTGWPWRLFIPGDPARSGPA